MKKRAFIFLLILINLAILFCGQGCGKSNEYDFRKTKWGMSKEEVKKTEELKPIIDLGGMLVYQTTLIEKPFDLLYRFEKNKLVIAGYEIQAEANKYDYLSIHESLVKLLQKKYGEPTKNEFIWKEGENSNYNSVQLNVAVGSGKLSKLAEWETDTSKIIINCIGMRSQISLAIVYTPKHITTNIKKVKKDEKDIDKI